MRSRMTRKRTRRTPRVASELIAWRPRLEPPPPSVVSSASFWPTNHVGKERKLLPRWLSRQSTRSNSSSPGGRPS